MRANELELVRKVLLWALALSALAAPRTYSSAPVPIDGPIVPLHTLVLVVLLVLLWRRLLRSDTVAALGGLVATTSSTVVLYRTAEAVHAGLVPSEAVGNIITPTIVSVAGVAFIGLGIRGAYALSFTNLLSASVAMVVAAGGSTDVLGTASAVNSLRFGIVAIVLFGIVGTIAARRADERDRAEQEEAAAARRAADLEHLDQLRDRLFTQAAHELKTPLTVLRTAVETLHDKRAELSEQQVQDVTETLWRMMERLQRRTEAVLDASDLGRLHDRDGKLVIASDATTLLEAALGSTLPVLGERPTELVLRGDATVSVDPERLEHVLENLLSNADKYSPAGTPVVISSAVTMNELIVTVTDTGTSLTPQEATRVFESGVRTDDARARAEGSGVGLAVVERYVRDWGGRVWCKPGDHGTTFGFSIPRMDLIDVKAVEEPTAPVLTPHGLSPGPQGR